MADNYDFLFNAMPPTLGVRCQSAQTWNNNVNPALARYIPHDPPDVNSSSVPVGFQNHNRCYPASARQFLVKRIISGDTRASYCINNFDYWYTQAEPYFDQMNYDQLVRVIVDYDTAAVTAEFHTWSENPTGTYKPDLFAAQNGIVASGWCYRQTGASPSFTDNIRILCITQITNPFGFDIEMEESALAFFDVGLSDNMIWNATGGMPALVYGPPEQTTTVTIPAGGKHLVTPPNGDTSIYYPQTAPDGSHIIIGGGGWRRIIPKVPLGPGYYPAIRTDAT